MSFCALCTEDIVGVTHWEPFGRNDALVTVCHGCATDAPVERDHLFGGSHGVGVGEGNVRMGINGGSPRKRGGR